MRCAGWMDGCKAGRQGVSGKQHNEICGRGTGTKVQKGQQKEHERHAEWGERESERSGGSNPGCSFEGSGFWPPPPPLVRRSSPLSPSTLTLHHYSSITSTLYPYLKCPVSDTSPTPPGEQQPHQQPDGWQLLPSSVAPLPSTPSVRCARLGMASVVPESPSHLHHYHHLPMEDVELTLQTAMQ